jgi:hypothetical protein
MNLRTSPESLKKWKFVLLEKSTLHSWSLANTSPSTIPIYL